MVSIWPWRGKDSSPASFEKALSALSAKITSTQAQLDKARTTSRRVRVLWTVYLSFAYLVYAIVEILVVGQHRMGPWEWTGMASGPVIIYVTRTLLAAFFNFRIDSLSGRLKDQQTERAKTIQKLKDATKYDSTLELLEKYGGEENKRARSRKHASVDDGKPSSGKGRKGSTQAAPGQRMNIPIPPTANIQRPGGPSPSPGTPQSGHNPYPHPIPPPSHGPVSGHEGDFDTTAEFAPNAYGQQGEPAHDYHHHQPPPQVQPADATPRWYDRVLDLVLGEDETAPKNRIVLICGSCKLVNGQAPPGTRTLAEVGVWKCMACGTANGETVVDEGQRIVEEVLSTQAREAAQAASEAAGSEGDEDASLVKVEGSESEATGEEMEMVEKPKEVAGKRKGKGKK